MTIKLLPLANSKKIVGNYYRWFNDQDVRQFLSSKTPKTKGKIKKWIAKTIKNKSCLYFSIILNANKKKINLGHIGLKKINKIKKKAEIGIVIGEKRFWQKGIGTIALLKIIKEAKKIKLKEVYAKVNKNNLASKKLFLKADFKEFSQKGEGIIFKKKFSNKHSHT